MAEHEKCNTTYEIAHRSSSDTLDTEWLVHRKKSFEALFVNHLGIMEAWKIPFLEDKSTPAVKLEDNYGRT